MKLRDLGEFELIERIRTRTSGGAGVQRGIGDDAAVLNLPEGHQLLTSTDLLLEEVIKGELSVSTDIAVDPNAIADQLTDLLEGSATFETNSVELSAAGTELLDMAIDILGANPTTVLTVEGHTDNRAVSMPHAYPP